MQPKICVRNGGGPSVTGLQAYSVRIQYLEADAICSALQNLQPKDLLLFYEDSVINCVVFKPILSIDAYSIFTTFRGKALLPSSGCYYTVRYVCHFQYWNQRSG